MRIVKIVNITAVVLMLALWVTLFFTRESYMGSGLKTPEGVRTGGQYFSDENPYGFTLKNKQYGFFTDDNNIVSDIWELDVDSAYVNYYPIEDSKIEKIRSIRLKNDSIVVIVGSQDSLYSVISFDTAVTSLGSFKASSNLKAVSLVKDNVEAVFDRTGKNVGCVFSVSDTCKMRTYDLPNFFNRICDIKQAFVEKNKWKFIFQTRYYQKNDVWVLIDEKNKSNHLIFDERAVYPQYLGLVNHDFATVSKYMDNTFSGLVPSFTHNDTIFVYRNSKIEMKKYEANKNAFAAWLQLTPDTNYWDILSMEQGEEYSNFSFGQYLSDRRFSLSYVVEDSAMHFLTPGENPSKQILLGVDEKPIGMNLCSSGIVLITDKLNFAVLSGDGFLKGRKTFFSLISSTINMLYPNTIQILEVNFPQFKALMYFSTLYSLFPLWLLSFIIVWLVYALKKKPLYVVRNVRKLSIWQQFAIGSTVYIILFAIFVGEILTDFNIF